MESNEPSHQQILEAHLHLLLDSYEPSDVAAALTTIVHTKYGFLRLVRVQDLNALYLQMNDVSHQTHLLVQTIMGQNGTIGRTMMDMLHAIKGASERVSSVVSSSLTVLRRITYED